MTMNFETVKSELRKYFDNYFQREHSYNKLIYDAMVYSINVGGKRIRPLLILSSYSMYEEDYWEVLPVAAAVEMIHTYSLIHDDLPCMDNDDLRRGKPTNHKVFGETIALLAGDALLNEAANIMFEFCETNGAKALTACKTILKSSGAEGMIGGQVVDILSEGKKISEDELLYMHSKKTGELIKSSVLAGAILGGASEEDIRSLETYGEKLGLAFQIKDDILDVAGSTEIIGKPVNSDRCNNKTTFVTTYGLEACVDKCSLLTTECLKILDGIEKNTVALRNITEFLLTRDY